MTENEMINGWTFEETVKTTENLMEVEKNMFKWDVLRHLRDFAEMYKEEIQQYKEIGTVEELRITREKQIPKKPIRVGKDTCPKCGTYNETWVKRRNTLPSDIVYCWHCGQAVEIIRE